MKSIGRRFKNSVLTKSGGGLLLSLCNLSLIGVAFSAWVYGSINSENANINISVGDVVNLSEYISTPTINAFEVCPTGIVVDETICYAGEINIKTDLSLKNGLLKKRTDIKDSLSLNIEKKIMELLISFLKNTWVR